MKKAALGLAPAFTWAWKIIQWPIVFLLASTGFGLVYYYAPDADQDWVWITPGALTATVLWLLAELNAEIERESPWIKNAGPKIMGQRKRLGLAASREWFKLHPRDTAFST